MNDSNLFYAGPTRLPEYLVRGHWARARMDEAMRGISALLGDAVTQVVFGTGNGVEIVLDGGPHLRVAPWTDADGRDSDAWSLSDRQCGHVFAVSCGGEAVRVGLEEPIRDWFR